MKVLILHGIGGFAGIHWGQWLHDQMQVLGYAVIMPTLPHSNHPSRERWLREIEDVLQDVDPKDLVIVGHSLGVASALDYIEQCAGKVRGLVGVSGFAEDYGAELNGYFMRRKNIDFAKVRQHMGGAVVLYGDDDPYVTQPALRHLADQLGVEPIVVKNGGHLNAAAGYTIFPRLLEAVQAIL